MTGQWIDDKTYWEDPKNIGFAKATIRAIAAAVDATRTEIIRHSLKMLRSAYRQEVG